MGVTNKLEEDKRSGVYGGDGGSATPTPTPTPTPSENGSGGFQSSLLNASGNSVGGKAYTPPKDNSSYYEALKNESYSTLLQSEIQASIARDQAMKYTQNQLNAQGYGTQGLSESSNIGAYNNYMGSVNQAQSDYRNSLLGIKQKEQEAKEDEFQQLATLMQESGSSENLDKLFDAYGINVDENGNLGGDYFNSLDPQSQAQLKYLYSSYKNDYSTTENEEKVNSFVETNAIGDGSNTYKDFNFTTNDNINNMKDTVEALFKDSNLSNLQNGDVIQINDGKNSAYLVYDNGKLTQITQDGYGKAVGTKYQYDKNGGLLNETQVQEQQQKQVQEQAQQASIKKAQDSLTNIYNTTNDINATSKGIMINAFKKDSDALKLVKDGEAVNLVSNGVNLYVQYVNGEYKRISKDKFDAIQSSKKYDYDKNNGLKKRGW